MLWSRKKFPFNVDLEKWNYLGAAKISFNYSPDNIIYAAVHFFVSRKDGSRHYYLDAAEKVKKDFEKSHHYIIQKANPWVLGSGELYEHIHIPSDFLKEYCFQKYQWLWDDSLNWWVYYKSPKIDMFVGNTALNFSYDEEAKD